MLFSEEKKISYIKNIDFGIDANLYIKKDTKESTYNFLGNGRFIFKDFDFNIKYKNPSTNFDEELKCKKDNFFWKGCFSFDELINVPFSISFGNLGFAGSFSKLNMPTISSGLSCFGNNIFSSCGISVGNTCVYESPLSIAYKYKFSKREGVLRNLGLVYFFDENGNWAESFSIDLKSNKNFIFSFAQTFGMFFIENDSASWFSKTDFFPLSNLYFGNVQFYFDLGFYKCRLLSSIYQSNQIVNNIKIFNNDLDFNFTFSFENLIKISFFSVNFDGFLSDSITIFTPSSNNLKTIFQLKINPVFNFIIFNNSARMRVGGVFYIDEKIDSNREAFFLYKWSSGVHINWRKVSLRLNFTDDSQKYSFFSSVSFKSGIKPFINLDCFFWPSIDSNYEFEKIELRPKFSMNINPNSKNLLFFFSNSYDLIFENQISSGISELSFLIKKRFEYVTFKSSIGIKFKFL